MVTEYVGPACTEPRYRAANSHNQHALHHNVNNAGTPALGSGNSVAMKIAYVAAWKLDCSLAMGFNTAATKGAVPVAINNACTQVAPYKDHCAVDSSWTGGKAQVCYQPVPGGAGNHLKTIGDHVCRLIQNMALCGGREDATRGGAHGACTWITTANLLGKCTKVEDCSAARVTQNNEHCGGREDHFPRGSHGRCMWCFGTCMQRTADMQCHAFCRTLGKPACTGPGGKGVCYWGKKVGKCRPRRAKCERFVTKAYCGSVAWCMWDDTRPWYGQAKCMHISTPVRLDLAH